MSQDIRFEQRWEFRNRESESSDDDSETSSSHGSVLRKDRLKFLTRGNNLSGDDDPHSSSSNAPFSKKRRLDIQNKENGSASYVSESTLTGRQKPKKHKLVADLVAVQSDEHEFCHWKEAKDKGNAVTRNWNQSKRTNRRTSTCKEMVLVNNKRERDFYEDKNSIKRNNVAYESTVMDDLDMFGKSVMEELKVGKQKMFGSMKEDLHGVLANSCTPLMIRKEIAEGKEMQLYGQLSVENVPLKQKRCSVKDMDIYSQRGVQPILIQYSRKCRKDVGPQHQKCSLEKIKSNQPVVISDTDGGLKSESGGKIKGTTGFLGGPVQRRELFDSVGSFQELANQGNPRHFFGSYLPSRITTRRRVHFRSSELPMILGAPSCSNAPPQNSVNGSKPLGSNQQQVPENRVRIKIGNINTPTTLMQEDNGLGQRMFSTINSFNRCCNPVASSKNVSSPAAFRGVYSKNCRAMASFDPAKVKAELDPSSIILALSSPVKHNSRKQQEERNVSSPAAFREVHSKNCRAIASFDPAKVKAALDPASIILALNSPVKYNSRKQQERNRSSSKNRRVSLNIAHRHS